MKRSRQYVTVDFWRVETVLMDKGAEETEAHYLIECEVWPGYPGTYLDPPEPPTVEVIVVREAETQRVRRDIQELLENDEVAMAEITQEALDEADIADEDEPDADDDEDDRGQ